MGSGLDPCRGVRWILAMGMDPCHGNGSLTWGWISAVWLGMDPCRGAALIPRAAPGAAGPAQLSALPRGRAAAKALPLPIGSGPTRPCPDPPEAAESSHLGRDRGTARPPSPLPVGDELLLKHLAVHRNCSPPLITIINHPALGRGCARFSRAGELLGLAGGFWGGSPEGTQKPQLWWWVPSCTAHQEGNP